MLPTFPLPTSYRLPLQPDHFDSQLETPMQLPKLKISLFPPKKDGTRYVASGNLTMTMADAMAFAEWLTAQPGEHDDYLNESVVKIAAFMYENETKAGNPYDTVSLVDLSAERPAPANAQRRESRTETRRAARPAAQRASNFDDEEVPF